MGYLLLSVEYQPFESSCFYLSDLAHRMLRQSIKSQLARAFILCFDQLSFGALSQQQLHLLLMAAATLWLLLVECHE
jgi:hypothetical protein